MQTNYFQCFDEDFIVHPYAHIMPLKIEDLHNCFFETMCALDSFCREHNIKYQIIYGTLIGAVREKDFIPWDDDVDVIMDRDNYDKLCSLSEECPEGYRLVKPGEDNVFFDFTPRFVCTKIEIDRFDCDMSEDIPRYVFNPGIDLFVLEPSYVGLRHKLHWYRKMLLYGLARGHRPFQKEIDGGQEIGAFLKFAGKLLGGIGKHMDLAKIVKRFDNISRKCHNKEGKVFNSNVDPKGILTLYDKKDYEDTIYLKIRGKDFPAPAGYDNINTLVYGDYMSLPDKKYQKPEHYRVEYTPKD